MSRPRIIGEPVPEVLQRPRCPTCGERLRPLMHTMTPTKEAPRFAHAREETDEPGVYHFVSRPTGEVDRVPDFANATREWRGQWHGYGAFCSLRCCEAFANAAYRGGYRMPSG